MYSWQGERGTHLLLALVISPLTTHPFRDGAPFLLLVETPPTFRRSVRFFRSLHLHFFLILYPSALAVCGQHLSPRGSIVFSLLSNQLDFSLSLPFAFFISSFNTLCSSLYKFSFSHHVGSFLVCVATRASLCAFLRPPPPGYGYTSFLCLAGPGPLHKNAVSAFSRGPLGRAKIRFYSYLLF